ncbi:hypothetical protein Trco_002475 [Trichoderma cornu-damae]|uniref:Uncharacterized protein n=1 Tax=Trichoderma cornu-damae TaxID=654480 RepID=A0A9P8TZ58_9HYPO|nr:hypothetical protein Trco_002475 [Trichoderma cornu-damae]
MCQSHLGDWPTGQLETLERRHAKRVYDALTGTESPYAATIGHGMASDRASVLRGASLMDARNLSDVQSWLEQYKYHKHST